MGIFSGYLLMTDMDGTLSVNEVVSRENKDAIRAFQQEGGLFTMATGRSPRYLDAYRPDIVPNAPIIAVNGTMIYDRENEKVLFSAFMDENAPEVPIYVQEKYKEFLLAVDFVKQEDKGWKMPYLPEHGDDFNEYISSLEGPWLKAIIAVKSEASDRILADLKARFGHRYKFTRSWPEGIEMNDPKAGKEVCARWLKEHSEGKIHTVVAAGDYENDLAMIQAADIGYAVGNAVDVVKQAADRITVPHTEHAIAAIINELKEEIIQNGNDEKAC